MRSNLEKEVAQAIAEAEYMSLTPDPVSTDHPDYELHTYFNSSLKKMRFARRCIYYSSRGDKGYTVKDLVYDLKISEVAVREMITTCMQKEWIRKIAHTNRYIMTERSLDCYYDYIEYRIKRDEQNYKKIINMVNAIYTLKETETNQ